MKMEYDFYNFEMDFVDNRMLFLLAFQHHTNKIFSYLEHWEELFLMDLPNIFDHHIWDLKDFLLFQNYETRLIFGTKIKLKTSKTSQQVQ